MTNRLWITLVVVSFALRAVADDGLSVPGLRAHIQPKSYYIPVGTPAWVHLSLENTSDKSITLTVPGTEPDLPVPEMGLPLSHVFSGPSGTGVSVTTQTNRRWEVPVTYRAASSAPILMIAPRGTVGTTIDLKQYFPALRSPGEYRVSWAPYGGASISETAVLRVTPLKQAEIITDHGTMTIRFFYEDAPKTVANFIELVDSGFYDGRTFHRIEPGYLIQGGCPRGDGTGIRPDGRRIPAEFNSNPHEKGSVSMALLQDDPDSASCQFFICYTRQRDWDGKYTVFGHLVGEESYKTLDNLMNVPPGDQGRPPKPLYLRSARIIEAPPEPLTDYPHTSR